MITAVRHSISPFRSPFCLRVLEELTETNLFYAGMESQMLNENFQIHLISYRA